MIDIVKIFTSKSCKTQKTDESHESICMVIIGGIYYLHRRTNQNSRNRQRNKKLAYERKSKKKTERKLEKTHPKFLDNFCPIKQ